MSGKMIRVESGDNQTATKEASEGFSALRLPAANVELEGEKDEASNGEAPVKLHSTRKSRRMPRGTITEIERSNWTPQQQQENPLMYTMNHRLLLTTVFSWRKSIIPDVLGKFDVWAATALHLILVALRELPFLFTSLGLDDNDRTWILAAVEVEWGSLGMCTTLLVFTLCFFNSECNDRYRSLYSACAGMGGAIQEVGASLGADFADLPEHRWDVVRYLVASAMLVYNSVYDGMSSNVDDWKVKEAEWKRLTTTEAEHVGHPILYAGKEIVCPPLLTAEEVAQLRAYTGNKALLLHTWAIRVAGDGYTRCGVKPELSPALGGVGTSILALRGHGSFITTTLALPVPFPYWHMLVLMSVVNYVFFALAFLSLRSWLSPIVMFFSVLLLSAIREVSVQLANPFGTDEIDFPVSKYITDLRANMASLILDTPWPTAVNRLVKETNSKKWA